MHRTQYNVLNSWNDPSIVQHINVALRLRNNILKIANKTTWKLHGIIDASKEDFISLCVSIIYIKKIKIVLCAYTLYMFIYFFC